MAQSYTPRLILPEMADGEQSGYVTFNELGQVLDALVQTVVQSKTTVTPPVSPADGELWIVPTGGTGAWAGHDNEIAQWYNNQWFFYVPQLGFRAWILDEEFLHIYQAPVIHAAMALTGPTVADVPFTTTPTAFDIADNSVVAADAPNPTTVDLTNSRFTINDYLSDFPCQVNAAVAIEASGNNVQYFMQVYKNASPEAHLRCGLSVTNQSAAALLVVPGGIIKVKAGDEVELRMWRSTGSGDVDIEAFSFSILPIS